MKETLLLSYPQAHFLTLALHQWLQDIRLFHEPGARLSVLQVISAEAIFPRLVSRLQRQLLRHHLGPQPEPGTGLHVSLSLAELLAVFRCLPLLETQPELYAVMTAISQLLTKYEPHIML